MNLPIPTGELAALVCAFFWALNGLLLRTQTDRIPPATMTAIRCGVAALLFWGLLPFEAPLTDLLQVPLREWGLLFASVSIGIGIGDTLYLIAIKEIGLSHTLALSGTFPLTTLLWETLLRRQVPSGSLVAGSCLVVLGVVLLSRPASAPVPTTVLPVRLKFGIALALGAAAMWGLSWVLLKPAIAHLTLVQANAARLPMAALFLYLLRILPSERKSLQHFSWKSFAIVAFTGLLGMGAGAYLFLYAVVHAGVAKAVTLTANASLFGVILGVIFLKEPLTVRLVLGIASCLAGVWTVL